MKLPLWPPCIRRQSSPLGGTVSLPRERCSTSSLLAFFSVLIGLFLHGGLDVGERDTIAVVVDIVDILLWMNDVSLSCDVRAGWVEVMISSSQLKS